MTAGRIERDREHGWRLELPATAASGAAIVIERDAYGDIHRVHAATADASEIYVEVVSYGRHLDVPAAAERQRAELLERSGDGVVIGPTEETVDGRPAVTLRFAGHLGADHRTRRFVWLDGPGGTVRVVLDPSSEQNAAIVAGLGLGTGRVTAASLASLHHDGSARYVVPGPGADPARLRIGDRLTLRVRAGHDAPIERLFLRTTPDGEQVFDELTEVDRDAAARWWTVELALTMPSNGYRFLVVTPDGPRWLNGSGVHEATPTDRDDFVVVAGLETPRWLADRVVYQIFPDRFANGDPSNDVVDGAWTYRGHAARARAWTDRPSREPGGGVEFFGGDLAGIVDHLDHLVDLGVNTIYLTPIFESRSNHGYDITAYDRVAGHFGGDAALVALREATRARDIRLLLDIAPNHVGVEHPWFQAAQADPTAPSASSFVFREHPDDYEAWLGVRSLPKLDYRSPDLRAAMYEGDDAVLRHWLRPPFSVDGWRIDVANMLGRLGPDQLGPDIARGLRAAVKAEDPDAYLLGEHAYDATDHLAGDQWDGVMDYWRFQRPVLDWLAGVEAWSHPSGRIVQAGRSSTETLVRTMTAFRAAIPWQIARQQLALLDSHDTPRIATVLEGDEGRIRAAFGLLLTAVGVPCVLYGDEIGLEGEDGTDTRRPMPWDLATWDEDRYGFVRSLVRLRVGSPALTTGGLQVIETGEDHFTSVRDAETQTAIVVVVRGPGSRPAGPLAVADAGIVDGTTLREHLTGATATVEDGLLPLPDTPTGVAIWLTDRP
jgi:alpha-glucosidase